MAHSSASDSHLFGPHAANGRTAVDIVEKFHRKQVSRHPFFVRLASRPGDLSAVWLLMANLREGISRYFIRWLARTIERVEDRRIGALIATQLADELGHGDFLQIHSVLLDRFVAALSRWRMAGTDEALLAAGRRLAEDAARPFYAADPYEGVGALAVGEIFAEKMDHALAREMRKQDLLTGSDLTWLEIHEKLEVHHAKDSEELAALIPREPGAQAAAWRGAEDQWKTLWHFLDEVHALEMSTPARKGVPAAAGAVVTPRSRRPVTVSPAVAAPRRLPKALRPLSSV